MQIPQKQNSGMERRNDQLLKQQDIYFVLGRPGPSKTQGSWIYEKKNITEQHLRQPKTTLLSVERETEWTAMNSLDREEKERYSVKWGAIDSWIAGLYTEKTRLIHSLNDLTVIVLST